jgi:hypothetical protein
MSITSSADMRRRLNEAIAAGNKVRGRPLTAREQLNNLRAALSEHDSDCSWHKGGRCSCGADEFRVGFMHVSADR